MNSASQEKAISGSLTMGMISIAALLFFLPFHETAVVRDVLFATTLLAFVVLIGVERQKGGQRFYAPSKLLTALLVASFLWGLVTLVDAIDPGYSSKALLRKMVKPYLLFFMAYSLFVAVSGQPEKFKWVFYPLVAAVLIMSVYGCYQFYQSPFPVHNRVAGFTGAFYRLAIFLVMAIPIVVAVGWSSPSRWRWPVMLVICISIAALIFTFTRSAWLAVLMEAIVWTGISGGAIKRLIVAATVLVLFSLAVMSYHSFLPKGLVIHGTKSEQARLEAISKAVDIIGKHPLTGIGYGKKTFSMYSDDIYAQHAHNLFLNTAVEMGIPGLLLLAIIFFVVVRDFVRGLAKGMGHEKRLLLAGIFASLVGFLTLNMFDYMYHGWPGQMLWILIGLGYALMTNIEKTSVLKPEQLTGT
ncbi:MAG: O-antigen ligase family protein [bacterium]|nr:O-antigen ligase family protein [bacterium]